MSELFTTVTLEEIAGHPDFSLWPGDYLVTNDRIREALKERKQRDIKWIKWALVTKRLTKQRLARVALTMIYEASRPARKLTKELTVLVKELVS